MLSYAQDRARRPPDSSPPGSPNRASVTSSSRISDSRGHRPGRPRHRLRRRHHPRHRGGPAAHRRGRPARRCGALLADGRREKIGGIAGHSVGEITAAAAAGILTEADAMAFVRERGTAMAHAAAARRHRDERRARRRRGRAPPAPRPARPVAGELQRRRPDRRRRRPRRPRDAQRRTRRPAPGSSRCRSPAHSTPGICAPRSTTCRRSPTASTASDPTLPHLDQPRRHRRRVTAARSSTCWSARSPRRYGGTRPWPPFAAAGVTGLIEVAPAGALVGLARRGLKGVPTVAVKTPDDLPAAIALIERELMTTPTLKQATGAKYTRIYSLGAARGDLTVTNDDIIGPINSSDEWIRQRTGIITRKRASAGMLGRRPRHRPRPSRPSRSRASPADQIDLGARAPRSATCSRRRRWPPSSPTRSALIPQRHTTSTPPAPATATPSPRRMRSSAAAPRTTPS